MPGGWGITPAIDLVHSNEDKGESTMKDFQELKKEMLKDNQVKFWYYAYLPWSLWQKAVHQVKIWLG